MTLQEAFRRGRLVLSAVAVLLAAAALAGCGGAKEEAAPASGGAAAEQPAESASPAPASPAAPEPAAAETSSGSSASTFDEFAGIAQEGNALGAADAPVTLVEYGDMQCPFCAQWAAEALPTVIDEYVRTGKLRLEFRGLAFIGPDSETALRTVVAAGAQNRMWEMVELLYANQGAENAGWVTDNLIERIGIAIPGLDLEKLFVDREADWVGEQIDEWAKAAEAAGIDGTPSFQAGPTGGELAVVAIESLDPGGITPALDALLGPA